MLNRLWQAVNICSARRAFALVYAGHAHVVSSDEANNFMTHDFESWRDFSTTAPEHEMVTTISWKIRVPRVIVLLFFDRLPKKEVKFTRHNVFERTTFLSATKTPASIAVRFLSVTSSISIMWCRATGEGRRHGKMWFARASHVTHVKEIGFRRKRTCA